MTTDEIIPDSDHFVTLDVLNTICDNDFIKFCPNVQIIDSSNNIFFPNIKT